ncbi:MAG TPA: arginase family protein, partial [Holophaga sp.]|nr:arginase family protein [Holophaga sp.]
RSLDPPERAYIAARGIRLLDSARVQESVDGWDASPVYAHIDLDVLDPREYPNLKCPEGGGLAIAALAGLLDRLVASGRLVGLSLLENTATARAHLERLAPILDAARRLGHA